MISGSNQSQNINKKRVVVFIVDVELSDHIWYTEVLILVFLYEVESHM